MPFQKFALLTALTLLNLAAIASLLHRPLPRPFPWGWALLFALSLLLGDLLHPLATTDRFYNFVALLSALIVGAHVRIAKYIAGGHVIAWALAVFVLADAVRLWPSPDTVVTAGELHLGGLIRRPYALAHPNLLAAWATLLPFGPHTLITALVTQSRGALLGLVAMMIVRYTPRRWLVAGGAVGAVVLVGGLLIRPNTALARTQFWAEGLRLFAARPVAGWGPGSYGVSLTSPTAEAQAMNAAGSPRSGMHTAHNAVITLMAEGGLLTLAPFVAMAAAVTVQVARSQHPAKWSVLAFAVQQMVDDQWLHPISALMLGLALAACLWGQESSDNHRKKEP